MSNGMKAGSLYVEITLDNGQVEKGLLQTQNQIAGIGNQVAGLGKVLAAGAIVKGLAEIGKAAINIGIEYESAFAGVKKTVDATEAEFQKLSDGIRDMAKTMPMAASEIAGVAEAAGQLGILTPNILDFTKVMSDLGVATNMGAEEAATALARLANITQMNQGDFDKLGSAIVGLGNNFATTESEIVNMSLRLAAAANQAGFSEAEIMGLSTALSSVGVNAEAGGGAMTRVLNKINNEVLSNGKNLSAYAEIAGMTGEEFKKAWGESAPKAFDKFVQGLGKAGKEGKSVSAILKDLGIKETIATTALMSLAGGGDLLARALEEANTAWEENVALTNEAGQRYETLESKIQIMKNGLADMGITVKEALDDSLRGAVDSAISAIDRIGQSLSSGELQGSLQTIGEGISKFVDAIADAAESAIPVLINGLSGIISAADTLSPLLAGLAAGFAAFKVLTSIASGIKAAEKAMKTLNVTMAANPIGAVITALVALGAAAAAVTSKLTTESREFKNSLEDMAKAAESSLQRANDSLENLSQTTTDLESNKDIIAGYRDQILSVVDAEGQFAATGADAALQRTKMQHAVKELNQLIPELGLVYDSETDSINMSSEALQKNIELQEELAAMEAYAAVKDEAARERARLTVERAVAQEGLNKALEKQNEYEEKQAQWGWKGFWLERTVNTHNYAQGVKKAQEAVAVFDTALEQNASVLSESGKLYDEATNTYTEKASQIGESTKTMGEAFQLVSDDIDAFTYQMALNDEELASFEKTTKEMSKNVTSAVTNMFGKISTKSDTSIKEMIKNLEHNRKAMEEWADNLQILAQRGIDQGLLAELERLGPEGAGYVKELAEASDKEFEEFKNVYADNTQAAIDLNEERLDAYVKTNPYGVAVDEMAEGMAKNNALSVAFSGVIEAAKKAGDTAVSNAGFQGTGENVAKGVANGVTLATKTAVQAIIDMVNKMKTSADKTAKIKSPSRLFAETGKYIALGTGKGIDDNARIAVNSVVNMTNSMYNEANKAISSGIRGTTQQVASEVKTITNAVLQAFGAGEAKTIGENWVKNWATSITASADLLEGAVKAVSKKGISGVEDWLKKKREKINISAEEELAIWKEVAEKSTKYRQEAEEKAFDLTKKIFEDRKKIYAVSAEEERAFWDAQAKQYQQGTLQRAEAEKNSIAATRDMIKEREEMEEVSAAELVKIWEEVTKKYKEGTAARAEADKELLKARKALFEEEKKLQQEQLKKQLDITVEAHEKERDAAISAMEKQLSAREDGLSKQIDAVKAAAEKETSAVKRESEARIEQYNREYDAKIKLLDEETAAEVAAIQAQIDAIDDLTKREDEAKRQAEVSEKLADLQTKLQSATGDERVSIQKQIDTILQDEARRHQLALREEEKNSLKQQIADVKAAAAEKKESLQAEKEAAIAAEKAHTESVLENIKQRSEAEIAAMQQSLEAMKQSNKEQIEALKKYYEEQIQLVKDAYEKQSQEIKNATMKSSQEANLEAARGLKQLVEQYKEAGKEAGEGFVSQLREKMKAANQIVSGAVTDALSKGISNLSALSSSVSAKVAPMSLGLETQAAMDIAPMSISPMAFDTFTTPLIDPNAMLKAQNGLYALMERETALSNRMNSGGSSIKSNSGNSQAAQGNPVIVNVNLNLNEARFNDRKMVSQLAKEVSETIATATARQTKYRV